MAQGGEYRINKLEKGPLQRFKNQNLLIKKYGEVGLQIYKAITGKRTTKELQKDLGVEDSMFDQVVNYMLDAGMIELEPVGKQEPKADAEGAEPPPSEAPEEPAPEPEEEKPSRKLEDIPPEEEIGPEEETPPLEEKPREKADEKKTEEPEIPPRAEKKARPKPAEEEITFEDIQPIAFGEEAGPEPAPEPPKEPKRRRGRKEEAVEDIEPIGGEPPEEEAPPPPQYRAPPPSEDIGIAFEEEQPQYKEGPELSPVEKIISDKYGDIGLRVYALIDGQRTAEEIMRETGLTEPKLVEILDFMDEQGIIKLDYPKGGAPPPAAAPPAGGFAGPQAMAGMAPPPQAPGQKRREDTFNPLTEGEESLDEARGVQSPVEIPIKAPMDIVKSVQTKAKIMLKYGDKGGKLLEQLDGKNDLIDISLRLDIPLFTVYDMLRFMMENGMVIMKPMSRADVRKKYGDDGYAVYKKFGKEGLMLYELIGKELTIRQMADKITPDKAKIIDMFIFIHKVLGIELPIDRDVLSKQLGL